MFDHSAVYYIGAALIGLAIFIAIVATLPNNDGYTKHDGYIPDDTNRA